MKLSDFEKVPLVKLQVLFVILYCHLLKDNNNNEYISQTITISIMVAKFEKDLEYGPHIGSSLILIQ